MNMEFNQHIIEYMTHCYSRQLRPKTMHSYESTLRLFERWCKEELGIETVDAVTESTIAITFQTFNKEESTPFIQTI